MAYLLDANVFIEAKKRWYGFDFCPSFWEWLGRTLVGLEHRVADLGRQAPVLGKGIRNPAVETQRGRRVLAEEPELEAFAHPSIRPDPTARPTARTRVRRFVPAWRLLCREVS